MTLRITQVRSTAGSRPEHRATLRTLGLRGIRTTVEREASPSLEAQLRLVSHMVKVEKGK